MSIKKVKVVYVITKADVGGAQKYVSDLVNNINKERFEAIIVSGREGGDLRNDYKIKWLTNDYELFKFFYKDWLALFEMRSLFKKIKPEVAHLNSSKAGVIGALAAKLAGVPKVVFTAHGWVFGDEELSWFKRQFYIWLSWLAARWQDVIINVSENDKRLALKHKIAPEKKLKVVINGIDVEKFAKNLFEREEARREIINRGGDQNLPKGIEGRVWIGSVGRLVKEKNYSLLIEAAEEMAREKEETFFFVIGEGEEKEILRQKIDENGLNERFFIVPAKGEDAKLMRAFNVFVLPSRKEGMPYTLIEARVAGVKVAVARTGGMPEIVPQEAVFEKGDKDDLVRVVRRVLRGDIQRGEGVEIRFDLGRVIKEIEKIYEGTW